MNAFTYLTGIIPNWSKWLLQLEEDIIEGQIELARKSQEQQESSQPTNERSKDQQQSGTAEVYGDAWALYSFSEFDRSLNGSLGVLHSAKSHDRGRAVLNAHSRQPENNMDLEATIKASTDVDAYELLEECLNIARERCQDAVESFLQYGICSDQISQIRRELDETYRLARTEREKYNVDERDAADLTKILRQLATDTVAGQEKLALMKESRRTLALENGYFQLGKRIGEGANGTVYEGRNMVNSKPVAIKFEEQKRDHPQLQQEWQIYQELDGCFGIPKSYCFDSNSMAQYKVLVIDLLGPSLEDLRRSCGGTFTLKTVAMLAKQTISRIQTVHEKNLVWRDVKPENLLMGRPGTGEASTVHAVDFGLGTTHLVLKTEQHISYEDNKSLTGPALYMSINAHLGIRQSRRDDLEALGYVLVYLAKGQLPWQGIMADTVEEKCQKIGDKKRETMAEDLCSGLPKEFIVFFKCVHNLAFAEKPDYHYLQGLFNQLGMEIGEEENNQYDWEC